MNASRNFCRSAATVILAATASWHVLVAAQPVEDGEFEKCVAKARELATKAAAKGASDEGARLRLEAAVTACQRPGVAVETAWFIGAVNTDLARFGQAFMMGSMSGIAYRNAHTDRQRKLRELGANLAYHKQYVKGDADGDLVPNSRDRCPATALAQPTDNAGCPVPGETRPPAGDESQFRRLLETGKLLQQESCVGAETPLIPRPFLFGRTQSPAGAFKLLVSQIGGMPEGCSIFYELYIRFSDPTSATAPPTKDLTLVFHEAEDLYPNPSVAAFAVVQGPQTSPNRTAAYEAFSTLYTTITIKARTAVSSSQISEWSAPVSLRAAPNGVP